jgi:hypothetical protein
VPDTCQIVEHDRAVFEEAGGLLAFAQFSGWVSFTAARFARPVPLILGMWVGSFLLYAAESWLSGDGGAMGSASGFLADWGYIACSPTFSRSTMMSSEP